jgi:hypothetical protein
LLTALVLFIQSIMSHFLHLLLLLLLLSSFTHLLLLLLRLQHSSLTQCQLAESALLLLPAWPPVLAQGQTHTSKPLPVPLHGSSQSLLPTL